MDFFSQYITDYRTLPNSKKTEIQTNWLAKDWIKAKYQKEEKQVLLMNEFYKANYPFNAGAGDGNLFRFFVEKNLSLLSKQGTLNYVLPSALMFEDGSINLRKHIFANYKINHFYSFENREAIFEEVHRSYKFALIQIGKSPQTNPKTNPQPPERGLLENENKNIVKEYAPELLDKTGHLKYNRELIPLAKQNRNNPTKAEKYIWDNLLANQKTSYKFIQQKTILNFILDFYCSELLLGIEIDGEYHEEREYQDLARSEELEKAKIKIIRYKNEDVLNNINFVKEDLSEQINKRIQEIEHFTSSLKAPFQGVGGTKTRFMQLDPDILWTNENIINYSFDLVKQISPDHLAYLELKDKKDISIIQKAYSLFPKLNPEYIDFRNELHMTADKDLFIENNPSLTASPEEGHSRTSHSNPSSKATFQGVGGLLPLYEGKMIWQFNSKFEKPKYWLDQKAFDERLKSKEISRMINDIYRELYPPRLTPFPEGDTQNSLQKPPSGVWGDSKGSKEKAVLQALGIQNKQELTKFIKYDREFFRLGFRAIASDTNERTLIFSLLPKNCGAGNSLYTEISSYSFNAQKTFFLEKQLFLLSIFNSISADWIARQMIQMNVNKTYILRLPIPQPSDKELESNENYKKLILNTLKLTLYYNYDDFVELAYQFNLTKEDIPKTQKQVDLLKIENDCMVAKLYQITSEELIHICSSFKVLNNKKPEYNKILIERYKA